MKRLSIGRFAKLTGLSVRALRLYDENGLLEPATVDPESRYRFYDSKQVNLASKIRALRQCDMSLEDIRTVINHPKQAGKIFEQHLVYLKDQLEVRKRMITDMENMIKDS
jgi:DNA-binding transcriptional MerR regulator